MEDSAKAPAEPGPATNVQPSAPVKASRAKVFIQKQYKWFVLAGSLIVSLTPSLKENFHERERELTSSIETKSNFSQLHEQALITDTHLNSIGLVLSELRTDQKHRLGGALPQIRRAPLTVT